MQSRPRGMWGEAQLAFSPLAMGSGQGCTHRGPFVLIRQPSRGRLLLLPQVGGGGPGPVPWLCCAASVPLCIAT